MGRWTAWARRRPGWRYPLESGPLRYEMDYDLGMMVCVTEPAYAECQGADDPLCGQCRFSVHGCNDSGPSRAEYISDVRGDL